MSPRLPFDSTQMFQMVDLLLAKLPPFLFHTTQFCCHGYDKAFCVSLDRTLVDTNKQRDNTH